MMALADGWQRKIEGRARIDRTRGTNVAAVTVDNASNRGKADAGARKLLLSVQPVKWAKQIRRIARIESRAVVAKEKRSQALILLDDPEFNLGAGRLGCEFPGIRQQIFQHDA